MSEYTATTVWLREQAAAFTDNRYSRTHRRLFDGGAVVSVSSSPQVAPVPLSGATVVDPEPAFVASLTSTSHAALPAHAVRAGHVIERYADQAAGVMARTEQGRQAITEVTLRPQVRFAAPAPSSVQQRQRRHSAHERCFIAASVRCAVRAEPAV